MLRSARRIGSGIDRLRPTSRGEQVEIHVIKWLVVAKCCAISIQAKRTGVLPSVQQQQLEQRCWPVFVLS